MFSPTPFDPSFYDYSQYEKKLEEEDEGWMEIISNNNPSEPNATVQSHQIYDNGSNQIVHNSAQLEYLVNQDINRTFETSVITENQKNFSGPLQTQKSLTLDDLDLLMNKYNYQGDLPDLKTIINSPKCSEHESNFQNQETDQDSSSVEHQESNSSDIPIDLLNNTRFKRSGRPKNAKTNKSHLFVKIGTRYVMKGTEEHKQWLVRTRENVKRCRERKGIRLDGEAQCATCLNFFKKRGLKTHEEKCPAKNLLETCMQCGGVFKKFGIKNHKKTCDTMMVDNQTFGPLPIGLF